MGLIKDIKDIEHNYWGSFGSLDFKDVGLYQAKKINYTNLINHIKYRLAFPLKSTNEQDALQEAQRLIYDCYEFPNQVSIVIYDKNPNLNINANEITTILGQEFIDDVDVF